MKILKTILLSLVLIGAINWGVVGLFDCDLVAKIFGDMSLTTRTIYSLVGFSALACTIFLYSMMLNDDFRTE